MQQSYDFLGQFGCQNARIYVLSFLVLHNTGLATEWKIMEQMPAVHAQVPPDQNTVAIHSICIEYGRESSGQQIIDTPKIVV